MTHTRQKAVHTNGTMKETIVAREEKRQISDMALFWLCLIGTVAVGLTISYCSGILNGIGQLKELPMYLPDWLVIAIPPVLFVHMGIALFLALRENVYTDGGRMVRNWTWAFWITLMVATAITPYFVFHGMPTASYALATVSTALALGTMILCYRQSIASGFVMTVFFIVTALIMVYLGYWAFA